MTYLNAISIDSSIGVPFSLFISPHRFLTANLDRVIGFVNLTNNKFMDTAKQGVN
jgi:hypothetical protein